MTRVALLFLMALMAVPVAGRAQADERAAEIAAAAREALGGTKLDAVTAISAEGPFRRVMGQRQMEGSIELLIVQPDRMRRVEKMSFGMPGGPVVERTSTLNGDEAWDEVNSRGGGGHGGMVIMGGGPRGPGGQAGRHGGPGEPADEASVARFRARRMQSELQRLTLALLLHSSRPIRFAGTAEASDGTADVLEILDDRERPVRLFLDQQTHLPLMLTYEDIRPRMVMAGGRGGPGGRGARRGGPDRRGGAGRDGNPAGRPSPEEMRRRMEAEGPLSPVTVALRFADYKDVDGVLLPHRIDLSIDNEPTEEWTIEQYRINPDVKADAFVKQ